MTSGTNESKNFENIQRDNRKRPHMTQMQAPQAVGDDESTDMQQGSGEEQTSAEQ